MSEFDKFRDIKEAIQFLASRDECVLECGQKQQIQDWLQELYEMKGTQKYDR